MLDEILTALIAMATLAGPYSAIVIGSDPPVNGIAMIADGAPQRVYRDIDTTWSLSVLLNGKNADQQTVLSTLSAIHQLMTVRKDFPSGDGWQIYSITTTSAPRLIGREQNSQWIYGSSLTVKFYAKGLN